MFVSSSVWDVYWKGIEDLRREEHWKSLMTGDDSSDLSMYNKYIWMILFPDFYKDLLRINKTFTMIYLEYIILYFSEINIQFIILIIYI